MTAFQLMTAFEAICLLSRWPKMETSLRMWSNIRVPTKSLIATKSRGCHDRHLWFSLLEGCIFSRWSTWSFRAAQYRRSESVQWQQDNLLNVAFHEERLKLAKELSQPFWEHNAGWIHSSQCKEEAKSVDPCIEVLVHELMELSGTAVIMPSKGNRLPFEWGFITMYWIILV